MFAFLALAAIAKFSRDGDYPLKKNKNARSCATHNPWQFRNEISF